MQGPRRVRQHKCVHTSDLLVQAIRERCDAVIVDTAGRLQIDERMMGELKATQRAIKPSDTLLVVDAMTGQEAASLTKAFNEAAELTGAHHMSSHCTSLVYSCPWSCAHLNKPSSAFSKIAGGQIDSSTCSCKQCTRCIPEDQTLTANLQIASSTHLGTQHQALQQPSARLLSSQMYTVSGAKKQTIHDLGHNLMCSSRATSHPARSWHLLLLVCGWITSYTAVLCHQGL